MSKIVGAVAIGKLIEYHLCGDDEKFMIWANFIADAYEENGDTNAAKLLRKRIKQEYTEKDKCVLDKCISTNYNTKDS